LYHIPRLALEDTVSDRDPRPTQYLSEFSQKLVPKQQDSMPSLPSAFHAHFEGTFDSVAASGTIYYNYINGVQRLDVTLGNGHNITEIIDYSKVC
jgi:hypothetical protein